MTTEPMEYRYPVSALLGDYLKAGLGIAITGVPLALAEPGVTASAVLWVLVALFVALALRTLRHQRLRFSLSSDGLTDGRTTVLFEDLSSLSLRHFSVLRTDRRSGWMELSLRAAGRRIRVESGLEGFMDIARRAKDAACARGIGLDRSTIANLRALGLDPERSDPARAQGTSPY